MKKKKMLDEEMGYFFGFPRGRYSEVLQELGRTNVHSQKTSSIPLAEFWQPENLGWIKTKFVPYLPGFDPARALKFFEFPTEAVFGGKPIGRPSMTDIMVLDSGIQMAVEGKFTEYVKKQKDETIGKWFDRSRKRKVGGMWTPESREEYLRNVLKAWLQIIREAGCSNLSDDEFIPAESAEWKDVSYQFLHRAASACCKAGVAHGTMPVLVYQLFFDAKNADHRARLEDFQGFLQSWAATLGLRNMMFLIVTVPITNVVDVEKRFWGKFGQMFEAMRNEKIYEFDFKGIGVKSGLDANEGIARHE